MQTIQFRVNDNYLEIILTLLKSLKQGIIEDLSIVKNDYISKQKIKEQNDIDSWQNFIDSTYGSFKDDPIIRANQGKYEQRELFK